MDALVLKWFGAPVGDHIDAALVTYLNAQGNHYAPPRELQVGLRFNTAK